MRPSRLHPRSSGSERHTSRAALSDCVNVGWRMRDGGCGVARIAIEEPRSTGAAWRSTARGRWAASSFAPRDATPEASTKRGVTRDHQSMTEAEVVIDSSGGEAMTTPSGPKLVLYSEQRAALSGAVDARLLELLPAARGGIGYLPSAPDRDRRWFGACE